MTHIHTLVKKKLKGKQEKQNTRRPKLTKRLTASLPPSHQHHRPANTLLPPPLAPQIHRGRPNTLGKAFEPVKMPNLLPKNLAGMNISIQSAGGSNLLPSSTVSIAAGRGRGRPVGSYKNPGPLPSQARGINTGGCCHVWGCFGHREWFF